MPSLTVRGFACIEQADLDLAQLTLIIGPQASGKSLLTKLLYYFQSIPAEIGAYSVVETSAEAVSERARAAFARWFPPSAWGQKPFRIQFSAGPFEAIVTRRGRTGNPRVIFSDYFIDHLTRLSAEIANLPAEAQDKDPTQFFRADWGIRDRYDRKFREDLSDQHSVWQLFIPAGRSFFTTIGASASAFEKAAQLDPATLLFGRLYNHLREGQFGLGQNSELTLDDPDIVSLMGGTVYYKKDRNYLLTADGRIIPLYAMSSGQQELLPLLAMLQHYGRHSARTVYIEEPEAHLFPSAQRDLIAYIASKLIRLKGSRAIITTHSPYLLSKINNLMLAGSLANVGGKIRHLVNQIVPPDTHLKPGSVSCYAIEHGRLIPLLEDDGLLNAAYIDQSSDEIADEFSRLLEIEYGNQSANGGET